MNIMMEMRRREGKAYSILEGTNVVQVETIEHRAWLDASSVCLDRFARICDSPQGDRDRQNNGYKAKPISSCLNGGQITTRAPRGKPGGKAQQDRGLLPFTIIG